MVFLFGLAPSGVYLATPVTSSAVRSYRTLSPLPGFACAPPWRSTLCCTGRRLAPPRRYLALCPVEPGLSSSPKSNDLRTSDYPADLATIIPDPNIRVD